MRGKVRAILVQQLMRDAFSYWRIVQVWVPIAYAQLDILASRSVQHGLLSGSAFGVIVFILRDLLVVLPTVMFAPLQLAYKWRKVCKTKLKRLLCALLLVFSGVMTYLPAGFLSVLCLHLIASGARVCERVLHGFRSVKKPNLTMVPAKFPVAIVLCL